MIELLTKKTVPPVIVFRILKSQLLLPLVSASSAPSAQVRQQPAARGTETNPPGDPKSLDSPVRLNCKKYPLIETRERKRRGSRLCGEYRSEHAKYFCFRLAQIGLSHIIFIFPVTIWLFHERKRYSVVDELKVCHGRI